jgi:hypothetical protein
MKVERLIVGWFTVPAGVVRSGENMERPIRCPIPACLVDTGSEVRGG